jgi:hypothetical protein
MTKTTRNYVKRLFKPVNNLPEVSESIMHAYIIPFFICNQNNCSRELNHNREGPSFEPARKVLRRPKQFLVLPLRVTIKVAFFPNFCESLITA